MRAIRNVKKYIAAASWLGVVCIACNDQQEQPELSSGKVQFTVVVHESGEDAEEIGELPDLSDYNVHLYNQETVPGFPKPFYGTYSQLPDEFTLPAADGYVIDIESCTYEEAVTANDGWGQRRLAGTSGVFEVKALEEHLIEPECTVANVCVTIGYSPLFPERFTEYEVTVSTVISREEDEEGNLMVAEKRALIYDRQATLSSPVGYFNIPVEESTVELTVEVSATTPWGEEKREERVYSLAAARHLHVTLRTAADDVEEQEEEDANEEEQEEQTRSIFRTEPLRQVYMDL